MGTTYIYFIAWFVVFPLLLVIMVFVNRAIYRKYASWKREKENAEILERARENERIIRESWGLDKYK